MPARRIIPCLDVKDGRVVKGVRFVELRDAGDPVEAAAAYDRQGADELCFLDISASHEGRGTLLRMVEAVARTVGIPFSVGGGVRTVDDVVRLLQAGADKVAVNTAAVADPSLVAAAAARVGSQCIVAAVDARRVTATGPAGGAARRPPAWLAGRPDLAIAEGAGPRFEVYTHGGRVPTGVDAVAWCRELAARGAGEILLTSMDRDGTRDGYDLELTRTVAEAVAIPVIASGGVGELEHLRAGVVEGEADAVLAASVFHFGELTVPQVKAFLRARGVEVRPPALPGGGDLLAQVRFDPRGLVPVVAQSAGDGEVLMVAWADRRALEATLASGLAHYHSRSRDALWLKGATSGHLQRVEDILLDCDGDTVLYRVHQTGPACHTGTRSCFGRRLAPEEGEP